MYYTITMFTVYRALMPRLEDKRMLWRISNN